MRSDIGKITATTLLAIIMLFGMIAARSVEAQPQVDLNMGFANAWTKIPSSDAGHHTGWSIAADAGWNFDIPLRTSNDTSRSALALSLIPGLRTQYLDIGPSNWLADGSRYRAWNALGIGPEMSAGIILAGPFAGASQELSLDTAFLANFCNYTDTTLYTAYTSWLIGARYTVRVGPRLSVTASLPVEFAARADGSSVIVGLGVGGRYAFKK